jgi:23S rRNA (uridine2552-2'-O)-methyltransferase
MAGNPYRRADAYTRAAREQGYPARSVFKLEEIDRKLRLLRRGQRVLDLGAAPGSWALYACERVGREGRVLAVDLKPLGVTLPPQGRALIGDAFDLDADALAAFAPYDVVLSDMAPSTTGSKVTDEARSIALFERALAVADALARPGASFVGKLFMGGDFDAVRAAVAERYEGSRTFRPSGTRSRSVEVFLAGSGRKGG